MTHFAILGAGTAGLACAIALARLGHAVSVFERHPSIAPVGAGILMQPSGVQALDALGVGEAFLAASVPVGRLQGLSHRGWPLVDVRYGEQVARGVSRQAMTTLLQTAARGLGVAFRFGCKVNAIWPQDDDVALILADADAERFDAVIVASGSGSDLAERCGLSAKTTVYPWAALHTVFAVRNWPDFDALQQRYAGPRKMFGLLPTGLDEHGQHLSMFWSLPATGHARWRQTPIEDWKQELAALWPEASPVIEQVSHHDQFSLATYRHAWPQRLAAGRVCLVGDAAHAMSPQLGLGSTLAVGDALALARVVGSQPDVTRAFAGYARARLGHVRRFQLYSRLLTPCFQSDLPAWWRDAAFAAGRWVPGMNAVALHSLAG